MSRDLMSLADVNYVFLRGSEKFPQPRFSPPTAKNPGKKDFKGSKAGQYSCNPLGKNPGDVWTIPNVKHNHVEKTIHPCQFPIELIERLVLSLTKPGDLVIDPYVGVGTAACAAVLHKRRAAGADIVSEYLKVARARIQLVASGKLRKRPLGRPIYLPRPADKIAQRPKDWPSSPAQPNLFM